MRTLEVRKLIEGTKVEIEISTPIKHLMNEWVKRFEELSGRKPTFEDYFYAGYIISNPIVADNLKDLNKVKKLKNKDLQFN